MSTALEQHPRHRRLLVALVTAVAALVIGVAVGVDAPGSSSGGQVAGTRVAAHELLAGPVVAAFEDIAPGEDRRTTTRAVDVAIGSRVAPQTADDLVDLASPARRTHILDGEVRPNGTFGGGHRAGTGFPGETEFPAEWSDDLIRHHISDIATDPASQIVRQQGRDVFLRGVRDGREIEVLLRNGEIWTAYPVRP